MRPVRLMLPLTLLAGALVAVPVAATAAPAIPHPEGVGRYVSLPPTRVIDTRGGGAVGQGETKVVDFAAQLPDLVVSAVVLNVTVTEPTGTIGYPPQRTSSRLSAVFTTMTWVSHT